MNRGRIFSEEVNLKIPMSRRIRNWVKLPRAFLRKFIIMHFRFGAPSARQTSLIR